MSDAKLYDVLGVNRQTPKDEIKRVYKKLAMKHHPDKEGGDADKFKAISEAYAILGDDQERAKYDSVGDSLQGNAMSHADMMAHVFAGMGMNMNMNMNTPRSKRRGDHLHTLNMSLREAFTGVTRTLRIDVKARCPMCVVTCCGACGGSGQRQQTHALGMMRHTITSTCAPCNGGGITRSRCQMCDSTGQRSTERILTVELPEGVSTGHRECFKGLGEQALTEGETPGDLFVEVCVATDPVFTRSGDDLQMKIRISLWDSIVGKAIVVSMFGGEVKFNTRSIGTGIMQPDKRYTLQGYGMPMGSGPKGIRGGLVVTFDVTYPPVKISDAQHAGLQVALQALGLAF